jgi:hypothetical protein
MKMKKRTWKGNLLMAMGLVLFLGVVLSACTITTVSLRYYDKTKPVEEYCRVYFARNWQILTFDGDNVANAFSTKNTIVIPGGEHTIGLRFADYMTSSSGVTTTVLSGVIPLKYNFTPDRFYYVYPTLKNSAIFSSDNDVTVNIVDLTDSTAAELRSSGFSRDTIEKILARRADSEEKLHKAKK